MTTLPLSILEGMLNDRKLDENYLIELNNGELVTLGDLTNFWIEGHQKIKKALDIIKESKEKVECKSIEKTKLQSKQEVERLQTPDECETKGIGPDNTKEIVQGSKSTSQEPKRRRIRKSDK